MDLAWCKDKIKVALPSANRIISLTKGIRLGRGAIFARFATSASADESFFNATIRSRTALRWILEPSGFFNGENRLGLRINPARRAASGRFSLDALLPKYACDAVSTP